MYRLLKIDFRKYFYNKTFWVLVAIYVVLNVIAFSVMEKALNGLVIDAQQSAQLPFPTFSLYDFPMIWHNLTFFGGFFKIFLALIVIVSVANEFSYKTIRQNVMNGMSRSQFLFSKVLFIFNLSLLSALVLFLTGTVLGLMKSEQVTFHLFFEKIEFIPAYFLELFTFNALALFIAFLLKRSGLAIGLLALYYYIIEPVASHMVPEKIAAYLPVETMGNLIDTPNSPLFQMFGVNFRDYVSLPDALACVTWSAVFILIVYLMMNKNDL